jgi:chemotaxis protein MotB
MILWKSFPVGVLVLLLAFPSSPQAYATTNTPVEGLDSPESVMAFSSGFLAENLPVDGTVLEDERDTKFIIGTNSVVYLRMADMDGVAVGDLFTVYRLVHKVFHPAHGRYLGWLTSVRGIVQVTKIDADVEIVTAQVIRAFNAITPGDGVMHYVPPAAQAVPPPDRTTPEIASIVAELPARHTLAGQQNVVYIDWGRQEGLMRGDHLDIYRPKPGRPLRWVGELRVLSVQDHSASALIVRSPVNILRGDRLVLKEPPKPMAEVIEDLKPLESEIKGVEIKREGDKLIISLVDQVLFDSGRAEIKPSGRDVLQRVSEILRNSSDQKILVEGHTDNVRIGRKLKTTFPTNWELSRARAESVLQYLTKDGGIDPSRITAAEYADTRPVASNATETGRQKNRRVEIILMPKAEPAPAPSATRVLPPESQPVQPQEPTPMTTESPSRPEVVTPAPSLEMPIQQ